MKMKRRNARIAFTLFLHLMLAGVLAVGTGRAFAAGLDAKEMAELRQARQLYKSGNYQEAANIFSSLSASHPDMPIFSRNAGAAYYYLKQPDPALSNLREYLRVQKKITTDDREEVDKWIAEMEQLRAQTPAAPSPPQEVPSQQPGGVPGGAGLPANAPANTGLPASSVAGGVPPQAQPQAGQAAPANGAAPQPAYPPPGYYPYAAPSGQAYSAPAYPAGPGYTNPATANPGAAPGGQNQGEPGAAGPIQPYANAYPYPQPSQVQPQPGTQNPQESVAKESQPSPKPRSALPWIVGGAGVATIALGGVFTYLYQSAYSDTRAQYNPDRESAGRTYSYLQFACYGLGAAGVATAIILLTRSNSSSTATTVSIVPALGPRVAGAELHVSY